MFAEPRTARDDRCVETLRTLSTSTDEIEALETGAIGLMALNMSRTARAAYKKLADAHNGVLLADLEADLRQRGIDVDALESDSSEI